ncbi:hypothetical protein SIN8267_01401 [Sinobacterium norvegicum]|uniref:Uncharacterized protein n=1 Tax=Sinobacterium norvegicum TaxID=1641715 RepID=A0ABN8EJH2_9GAMM|nr:hypothetical protein [Sinobacterium norvegicum]CAH0991299.1 hypothetical protein SIN8267_01401 [Sinobacterium norvegicum]
MSIQKQILKAFRVGDSTWKEPQCIIVFAFKGTDAKVLGSDYIDWPNWLTLRAERAPDHDQYLVADATEAYIDKARSPGITTAPAASDG